MYPTQNQTWDDIVNIHPQLIGKRIFVILP